ncbi:hypothetical protein N0V93_007966 [Gnomoniopsis smithogilvyi]|uniref:Uncharacterized protein n=1 Tax=Gnomoniopsis smithogilvyi TaxID=1191159 RepID=A0A9W9CTA1_9PEZI|nr:hypothetical protein N0V93_007966 [Gnomoniopsis smithogilvyi]
MTLTDIKEAKTTRRVTPVKPDRATRTTARRARTPAHGTLKVTMTEESGERKETLTDMRIVLKVKTAEMNTIITPATIKATVFVAVPKDNKSHGGSGSRSPGPHPPRSPKPGEIFVGVVDGVRDVVKDGVRIAKKADKACDGALSDIAREVGMLALEHRK